jgi:hypothetical protein
MRERLPFAPQIGAHVSPVRNKSSVDLIFHMITHIVNP